MNIHTILRSCTAAIALVSASTAATADPVPVPDGPDGPEFCFRVTDIERFGVGGNNFAFSLEVLNWTDTPGWGLSIATNIGSTSIAGSIPTFVGAGIDRDGRGGPLGGDDIDAKGPGLTVGSGTFDTPAIHSGRGRGDVAGLLNDWEADFSTSLTAQWSGDVGVDTAIPNQDLFNAPTPAALASLIPLGGVNGSVDGLRDSATDGGPGIPLPYADGSGNSLDGITLSVSDWNVGEVLSFNWFLLDNAGIPTGSAGVGNPYGFGIVNIARVNPVTRVLPGPVFMGNSGFSLGGAGSRLFFDSVNEVPNPALFAMELGAGITGGFVDPSTNIFGVQVNTTPVPIPAAIWLMLGGLGALGGARRYRRAA